MNTVNVSRRAGWLRVLLSIACFCAIALTAYGFLGNHRSAFYNMRSMEPVYFYAIGVGLLVTFLAAIVGTISGVAAVRAPGNARGWVLNTVLAVLLALTLFVAQYTQEYVAYLD